MKWEEYRDEVNRIRVFRLEVGDRELAELPSYARDHLEAALDDLKLLVGRQSATPIPPAAVELENDG